MIKMLRYHSWEASCKPCKIHNGIMGRAWDRGTKQWTQHCNPNSGGTEPFHTWELPQMLKARSIAFLKQIHGKRCVLGNSTIAKHNSHNQERTLNILFSLQSLLLPSDLNHMSIQVYPFPFLCYLAPKEHIYLL